MLLLLNGFLSFVNSFSTELFHFCILDFYQCYNCSEVGPDRRAILSSDNSCFHIQSKKKSKSSTAVLLYVDESYADSV